MALPFNAMQQISQAFAPKVDQPGPVIGAPNPMQIQQQQQAQGGSPILDRFQVGPQTQGAYANPQNNPQLFGANQELIEAAREYEQAATPVTTGLGRLGVLEGIARRFTSRDERDAYHAAQDKAAYEKMQADQAAAQATADNVFQMAVPLVGQQQARAMAAQAMTDPKYGQQAQESLLDEHKRLRENQRDDAREQVEENELFAGLVAMGIPAQQAKAFSQMENANIDNIAEMYFGRQDKLEQDQKQAYEMQMGMNREKTSMRNSVRQVERTMKIVGPWSAGFGSYLNLIRGSDAKDLKVMLDTQKATIAFESLQAMRTDPRNQTGGALGNVSNREVELLYNSYAGLSEEMSDDQLRTSLGDIAMGYDIAMYGMENEGKFFELVKAGKMTEEEAADILEQQAYNFANQRMVARSGANNLSGLPKEAQQEGLAMVANGEMDADEFESTFGWRPALPGDRYTKYAE